MKNPNNHVMPGISSVLDKIARGMELDKCRKCGCMQNALAEAVTAFSTAEDLAVRSIATTIRGYRATMEPIAYDCLGCKICWGAESTVLIAEQFGQSAEDCCGGSCSLSELDSTWPPHPGDYIIGNVDGSVAVCTLSSYELAAQVMAQGEPSIAIAGRCDTENIGIEKIVLNLLAKSSIRWLILCGDEAPGHRAGNALLHLKEDGVDANMRILKAASWRPVLRNLPIVNVSHFREQVNVVNLIGNTRADLVLAAARECASHPATQLKAATSCPSQLAAEHIMASSPERLELDPAGFFVILLKRDTGVIICEHYENSGRLTHVIEGKEAALIASTAVEQGLTKRLDHAAYLGRELTKAEIAIGTGNDYVQDAALGILRPESSGDGSCSIHESKRRNS